MTDDTRTIDEKLREYNKLAAEAVRLGLAYRERKCFKDQADATKSLAMVESSLRAARGANVPERKQIGSARTAPFDDSATDEEESMDDEREVEPDFAALKDPQELVDAYNALVAMAVDKGWTTYSSRKDPFDTLQEGAEACTALHADINKVEQEEKQDVDEYNKKTKAKPKAKKAKNAVKATKVKRAASNGNGAGPRGEKMKSIDKLLSRKSGCTAKDVLELTGWPAVSMPAMAKACGLKLRKEKEKGSVTRYYGE